MPAIWGKAGGRGGASVEGDALFDSVPDSHEELDTARLYMVRRRESDARAGALHVAE